MASVDYVQLRKFTIGNYKIYAVGVYVSNYNTSPNLQTIDIYNAIYALSGLVVNGFSAIQNTHSSYDSSITGINVADSSNNLKFTQSVSYSNNMQIVTPRIYINNTIIAFTDISWGYDAGNPRIEFAPLLCFVDTNTGNMLSTNQFVYGTFTNKDYGLTVVSENNTYKMLITNDSPFYGAAGSTSTFNPLGVNIDDISEKTILNPDPYSPGGESEPGGGAGDFDGTSDPIDFPSLPTLGAVDSGFITLFNPDLTELQALARYMWTNPLFDISAWKKIFADPMDAIIGLSIVPVAVPDSAARPIVVGNIVTDVSMKVATTQFIEVQCGSLNVNEFWGAYLDYDPYTKAEIYLPFCGVHQLSVDDIMNKTVEVRYHIDILSGACCAFVKCGESVLYQFIGQCASSIPISGTDFTNVINGVLSAATAIGSLVATGGASAPLSVPALSATAANAMKPNIEKSGAMGGTGGMLAILKPYLVLTRPKQALPANQNHFTGYPAFITENLGDLSGYTEIEKIHLEGVAATDDELSEIETLLKGGVIL